MTNAHATLRKFDYPQSVLAEFQHWLVLLRPQQVTLGALVLVNRGEEQSLAELPKAAFSELADAAAAIDTALRRFRAFDRINYLALMMVDPHVHFHVLPRYGSNQEFEGMTFRDWGWPGAPDLKQVNVCPDTVMAVMKARLMDAFGKGQ